MVKLTPELIEESRQFVNPVQDRELDLRGYKIPVIENLGATYNQFDTIDFTDNDLRRLENFPLLPRLKCLFLNNNRVSHIEANLGQTIPNVHTIVLTNNNIQELGDLDTLSSLPKLEHLSLMGNPVTKKPQYRTYLIHKIPQLRVLDYRRIRLKERQAAKAMFSGAKGKALQQQLGQKSKTFEPGEFPNGQAATNGGSSTPMAMPSADVQRIKEAIAGAKSLQEMERLQEMLESGQIPGKEREAAQGLEEEQEEEEEDEEEEENGEEMDGN